LLGHPYNGLVYYTFESLSHADLIHGVFTRLGGVSQGHLSSLNVGASVGDNPEAVAENYRRLFAALDLSRHDRVTVRQVHGSTVMRIGAGQRGQIVGEADAMISDTPGLILMQRFADCVPILLWDARRRAIGLAHAGWRGTLLGIAREVTRAMMEAFGSRPDDLAVGLGPGIGPCCYQVGAEIAPAVNAAFPHGDGVLIRQADGSYHLDLWEANRQQLAALGVEQIQVSNLCTACHTAEFYSHRAEKGKTGRFGVVVGLR